MAASRCVQDQVFSMLSLKDENKIKFGKNRFALHRLRAEQICVFFLRLSHPSRMLFDYKTRNIDYKVLNKY